MRRTKILATLGPATSTPSEIQRLIRSGADGVRVNFSHGSDEDHRQAIARARSASARLDRPVFIVADLQGPKIRIGDLLPTPILLRRGAPWVLDADPRPGGPDRAPLEAPSVARAARRGDAILLGDGSVELRVESVSGRRIVTRVAQPGEVRSHMGVFLPDAHLRTEVLGPKDRHDLGVALAAGVDYVALSFVRSGADVRTARREAGRSSSGREVGWIAKIERGEALAHIEEILDESDALMVARGDLGIEVPLERLALEQKRLVARSRAVGKPSIVATQMLLSMVDAARPTRAEATDVANAVLDGADALMLSEESAVGHHPFEAVGWLARIAEKTESAGTIVPLEPAESPESERPERAVAGAAVRLARDLDATAIVTPTHSGRTARWVASLRPPTPILALTSEAATFRRLGLVWGVRSVEVPQHLDLGQLRSTAWAESARLGGRRTRGPLVLTAGYPVEGRPTNLLTIVEPERPGGGSR